MSFLSDARKSAMAFAKGGATDAGRAYRPGRAGIPAGYLYYGAQPEEYAPEIYGEYPGKSNAVFSVTSMRAEYLSALPLRLYEATGGSSVMYVPRGDENDGLMESIAEKLGIVTRNLSTESPRNIIATLAMARSPAEKLVMTRQMGLEEITEGPIHDLLHYVNDFWTLNRLIRMTSMCLDLWGQSYIFVERGRSGRGEPKELWWAKPTQVRVIPHPVNYISHYEYDPISGGPALTFMPRETIRIYYPNPDDEFQPLSPLASARLYADHDQASMHANLNLHRQGLQPGAVVYPTKGIQWTEEQAEELEDDINTRLGGYDRAHRWAVLRNEVTVDRGGVTPKDSEFLGGMEHDLMRVCNAYHWPIDLVAGKRTYENIDQALKQAWQTTVVNGAFITAELSESLVPMFDRRSTVIPHFDASRIPVMQESESLLWERESEQIDLVITRNEWRRSRGMEPVEGGDKLWQSEQKIPIDSPAAELPAGGMPAGNTPAGNGQVPEQELATASNGSER